MSQMCAQAAWRQIFVETVRAFLDELGYQITGADGRIDERHEDEQIRRLCDNLTARQRLKTYSQLYALGCRIDGIERAIERLTTRPFDVGPRAS
jgi:polyhydroxyalkanoate synthesis regulator phasin